MFIPVCKNGHEYRELKNNWCPTCRKEYRRRYYLEHTQEDKKRAREWNEENRERYLSRKKEYREKNPEKLRGWYKTRLARRPLDQAWRAMIDRCENPKNPEWHNYGGRGIAVCDRWKGASGYENFEADMGLKPAKHLTLDRENNSLGYFPGNCRWATRKQQARNMRDNTELTLDGRTMCLAAWAEEVGITPTAFHSRILRGWNETQLLQKNLTPAKQENQSATTQLTRQLVADGVITSTIIRNERRGAHRTLGPGAKALAAQYGIKETTLKHYGTAKFLAADEDERQRVVANTRKNPYILKKKALAENAV